MCISKNRYFTFKEKYHDIKIGLSKFCDLCPKWCVNVSHSGIHSVCVCTQHQNTILLCNAANLKWSYKDLMSMIVCSTENKMCMVNRCVNCPGKEVLQNFLTEKLTDESLDNIIYTQWQSTDWSTLKTLVSSPSSYWSSRQADIFIHCKIVKQSICLNKSKIWILEVVLLWWILQRIIHL